MNPSFGDSFKQLRQRMGVSNYVLARTTGLNAGYLSRLESGQFVPGPDNLLRLAKGLGVDYDDLASLTRRQRPPLPRLRPYLRAAYGMSEQGAADVERYVSEHYGTGPGPLDGEDEDDKPFADSY